MIHYSIDSFKEYATKELLDIIDEVYEMSDVLSIYVDNTNYYLTVSILNNDGAYKPRINRNQKALPLNVSYKEGMCYCLMYNGFGVVATIVAQPSSNKYTSLYIKDLTSFYDHLEREANHIIEQEKIKQEQEGRLTHNIRNLNNE